MKINDFETGLKMLCDYYGKEVSGSAKGIWFEFLGKELTIVEFKEAIAASIINSRFMPTPAELVAYAKGSKESQALMEWQVVLHAAARLDHPNLSTRGFIALRAIGGIEAVAIAEPNRRENLERNFVKVFIQSSAKDSYCLPSASSEPLKNAARDEEDVVPIPKHLQEKIQALKKKMGMDEKK